MDAPMNESGTKSEGNTNTVLAEHPQQPFSRRLEHLPASLALFFSYSLPKYMISTVLKSMLLASPLFFTAKKPNLFFVQRKSGITAISTGTDENLGKTFR